MNLRNYPLGRAERVAVSVAGALALLVFGGCAHHKKAMAPMSEAASEQAAAAAQAAASGANQNPNEPTNAIPPDFAKTLIYPESTVQHVRKPKGVLREILFTTNASLEELVKFYKADLPAHGFEVTSTLKLAARGTFESDFHKGGRQGSVMLYPESKGSKVTIIDIIYEEPAKVNPEFAEPTETWDVIGPGEVAKNDTNPKKRN